MDQEIEASQPETALQKSNILSLPPWPTSKPGPMVTEPPAGQKRVPHRTEQVIEIDYDQEHGVPTISRTEV
jgi:hypothetical protein